MQVDWGSAARAAALLGLELYNYASRRETSRRSCGFCPPWLDDAWPRRTNRSKSSWPAQRAGLSRTVTAAR